MPIYRKARELVNESAVLYISTCLFTLFRFFTGFLIARFLGPTLYGLRAIFGLVLEYEYFSHLGTFDAMRREIPYFRGRKNNARAKHLVDNVFGVNLLYSLAVFTFLTLSALYLLKENYEIIYVDFAIFLGIYSITNKIKCFYTVKLVVDKKAHLLSKVKILEGCINAIACVVLVYYFGLRGLFIGLLISSVTIVVFMVIKLRWIPGISISPHIIWGLLKIGFPIMVIGLMFIVLRGIDRVIIAAMLPKEMLGYFAIGTIVSGAIYLPIADMLVVIFSPRIMEKLGKTGDIYQIKDYFIEPTVIVAYLTPFLAGILFLGIHLPIQYFLQEYIPAIHVAQVLVLGSFFFSIATVPLLICVALNKQVKAVFITFIAVVLNAILSYLFIIWGWGIQGVAVGTAMSHFVFSLITIWYGLKQLDVKMTEYLRFFALVYAPFPYAVCLLLFLDKFFIFDINGFWGDVFHTSVEIAIFFLMFSLVFVFVRKHVAFRKMIESLPIPQWKVQTGLR